MMCNDTRVSSGSRRCGEDEACRGASSGCVRCIDPKREYPTCDGAKVIHCGVLNGRGGGRAQWVGGGAT
jgi:hypothetical protein